MQIMSWSEYYLIIIKIFTEKRLQEKEKLLQNLQSQYHDLGKCPAQTSGACTCHLSSFRSSSPNNCARFQSFPLRSLMRWSPR